MKAVVRDTVAVEPREVVMVVSDFFFWFTPFSIVGNGGP